MVALSLPISRYHSPSFSFKLQQQASTVCLLMQFGTTVTNTRSLPHTYTFLKKNIPSILKCQCFNDEGLPFSEEVKQTEVAHLFEHILLDQLCQEKSLDVDAEFSGTTEWDWKKYPVGSFKVTIESKKKEGKYLAAALNKSILLMEELLNDRVLESAEQHKQPS